MNWAFLSFDLIIPLACLVFGIFSKKIAAGKINLWIGYRSARSVASREAWEYANLLTGKILLRGGIAALVLSLGVGLWGFFFHPWQSQGTICTVLTLAQTVALVVVIPVVEKKLKVTFE